MLDTRPDVTSGYLFGFTGWSADAADLLAAIKEPLKQLRLGSAVKRSVQKTVGTRLDR